MTPLALRQFFGLSQEAFARKLGYSVGSISKWETGRTVPGRQAQAALARLERRALRTTKREEDRHG